MNKICPLHKNQILSVCFFKGCAHPFLCRKCLQEHPKDHDASSHMKDIAELMAEKEWIEVLEKLRDSELIQAESAYKQRKDILVESEKMLRSWVTSIIMVLEDKLCIWTKELNELINFNDQQEVQISFNKPEDDLEAFRSLSSRDPLDTRVGKDKVKGGSLERGLDHNKLEKYKEQFLWQLRSLSLKVFLSNEPLKNLESIKQSRTKSTDEMDATIQKLEGENMLLREKIDLASNEISRLKTEACSLLNSNQKLSQELSRLSTVCNKFESEIENTKLKSFLSEDSKIVTNSHYAKLDEWIPKPAPNSKLRLNLLYRGSRDGFVCKKFYEKCGTSSPTISFIKSKSYGRIFGGYTTKSWKKDSGYIQDKNAFIFSLTYNEKYPCKDPSQAIYGSKSCMLCFGGGGDIVLYDNCDVNKESLTNFPYRFQCSQFDNFEDPGANSYLAGAYRFSVEEVEVYQVIWI